MWYSNWIPVIEEFCKREDKRRKENDIIGYKPGQVVERMHEKGYIFFSIWAFNQIEYEIGLSRDDKKIAAKSKPELFMTH